MNEINGSIWYDVISNEKGVITNFYDKNVAIKHAKEKGYKIPFFDNSIGLHDKKRKAYI